jgi:hypothetical protein
MIQCVYGGETDKHISLKAHREWRWCAGNLGSRWSWAFFMSWLLYPKVPIDRRLGGPHCQSECLGEKKEPVVSGMKAWFLSNLDISPVALLAYQHPVLQRCCSRLDLLVGWEGKRNTQTLVWNRVEILLLPVNAQGSILPDGHHLFLLVGLRTLRPAHVNYWIKVRCSGIINHSLVPTGALQVLWRVLIAVSTLSVIFYVHVTLLYRNKFLHNKTNQMH